MIGKTITLPIAVSDPFDQLHKGVIPREVDGALLESGRAGSSGCRIAGVVVEADGRTASSSTSMSIRARSRRADPPTGDFAAVARDSLQAYLPDVHDTALFTILADDAPEALARCVAADPAIIGKTVQVAFPVAQPSPCLPRARAKVLNPRFSQRRSKPSTRWRPRAW